MHRLLGRLIIIPFILKEKVFTSSGSNIDIFPVVKALLNVEYINLPNFRLGECLNIIALGGSITCGCSLDAGRAGCDRTGAWPQQLQNRLNSKYPCQSGHRVFNFCKGGVGSDTWADQISLWRHENSSQEAIAVSSAHLILIDSAVNDVVDIGIDEGGQVVSGPLNERWQDVNALEKRVKSLTELIIIQIPLMKSKPEVIFTELSINTGFEFPYLPYPSAAHLQLEVAQYYHRPYFSIISAFDGLKDRGVRRWFDQNYHTSDCCHVTRSGHELIGDFLIAVMEVSTGITNSNIPPWFSSLVANSRDSLPIKFNHVDKAEMYRAGWPLLISTVCGAGDEGFRTRCDGWEFENERGKPGLIARDSGSVLAYVIKGKNFHDHTHVGVLHISALRSYTNMGAVTVQLYQCVP